MESSIANVSFCCGRANDSMKKTKTFTNILQDYGRLKNVFLHINITWLLLVVILFWHQSRGNFFYSNYYLHRYVRIDDWYV